MTLSGRSPVLMTTAIIFLCSDTGGIEGQHQRQPSIDSCPDNWWYLSGGYCMYLAETEAVYNISHQLCLDCGADLVEEEKIGSVSGCLSSLKLHENYWLKGDFSQGGSFGKIVWDTATNRIDFMSSNLKSRPVCMMQPDATIQSNKQCSLSAPSAGNLISDTLPHAYSLICKPHCPPTLELIYQESDYITLGWQANWETGTRPWFRVSYTKDNGTRHDVTQDIQGTSVNITNVKENVTYTFTVEPLYGTFTDRCDKSTLIFKRAAPDCPTDLQVTDIGIDYIMLSWQPVPSSIACNQSPIAFFSADSENDKWTKVKGEVNHTSVRVGGLKEDTDYVFRVVSTGKYIRNINAGTCDNTIRSRTEVALPKLTCPTVAGGKESPTITCEMKTFNLPAYTSVVFRKLNSSANAAHCNSKYSCGSSEGYQAFVKMIPGGINAELRIKDIKADDKNSWECSFTFGDDNTRTARCDLAILGAKKESGENRSISVTEASLYGVLGFLGLAVIISVVVVMVRRCRRYRPSNVYCTPDLGFEHNGNSYLSLVSNHDGQTSTLHDINDQETPFNLHRELDINRMFQQSANFETRPKDLVTSEHECAKLISLNLQVIPERVDQTKIKEVAESTDDGYAKPRDFNLSRDETLNAQSCPKHVVESPVEKPIPSLSNDIYGDPVQFLCSRLQDPILGELVQTLDSSPFHTYSYPFVDKLTLDNDLEHSTAEDDATELKRVIYSTHHYDTHLKHIVGLNADGVTQNVMDSGYGDNTDHKDAVNPGGQETSHLIHTACSPNDEADTQLKNRLNKAMQGIELDKRLESCPETETPKLRNATKPTASRSSTQNSPQFHDLTDAIKDDNSKGPPVMNSSGYGSTQPNTIMCIAMDAESQPKSTIFVSKRNNIPSRDMGDTAMHGNVQTNNKFCTVEKEKTQMTRRGESPGYIHLKDMETVNQTVKGMTDAKYEVLNHTAKEKLSSLMYQYLVPSELRPYDREKCRAGNGDTQLNYSSEAGKFECCSKPVYTSVDDGTLTRGVQKSGKYANRKLPVPPREI